MMENALEYIILERENREMEHDTERDDNEQPEDEAKNFQTTVNEEYRENEAERDQNSKMN